jgi:hypothetical protein
MKRRTFIASSACGAIALVIPGIATAEIPKCFKTYDHEAIKNLNFLLKHLRVFLRELGSDIFTTDQLVVFLERSMGMIRGIGPHTPYIAFYQTDVVKDWSRHLVCGASLVAIRAHEMIEGGHVFPLNVSSSPHINAYGFKPPNYYEIHRGLNGEFFHSWVMDIRKKKGPYFRENIKPTWPLTWPNPI